MPPAEIRTDPRLHPLHAILLAFPMALFSGALLSDITYLNSAEMQWSNFFAWLIRLKRERGIKLIEPARRAGCDDSSSCACRPPWCSPVRALPPSNDWSETSLRGFLTERTR